MGEIARTFDPVQWADRVALSVELPVDWTAEDVAEEAAQMWEEGYYEPACRGGALVFAAETGQSASLADLFQDDDDPSWPLYAEAVWVRLVEVCAAMLNRRLRRAEGREI